MSKSFVSLEKKLCLVTGKEFMTNSLLLDRRIKNSLDKETLTGWGVSPEVQEKFDQGYIALVGVDISKSTLTPQGTIMPEDAYRTGEVAYLKEDVAKDIFNIKFGPINFVEPEVIQVLKSRKDVHS